MHTDSKAKTEQSTNCAVITKIIRFKLPLIVEMKGDVYFFVYSTLCKYVEIQIIIIIIYSFYFVYIVLFFF